MKALDKPLLIGKLSSENPVVGIVITGEVKDVVVVPVKDISSILANAIARNDIPSLSPSNLTSSFSAVASSVAISELVATNVPVALSYKATSKVLIFASFAVCNPSLSPAFVTFLTLFFTDTVKLAVAVPASGVGSTLGIGSSSFEHAANAQAIIVPNNKFLSFIYI